MLAITLPPFLTRYVNWIQANPALGAVSVLVILVVMLWLLRKSMKVFMVILGLAVIALVASYFIYGPEKTNNIVRDKTKQAIEQGKDLVKKDRDKVEEEIGKTSVNPDGTADPDPSEEGDGQ
jgi:hypothetical protein